MVEHPGHTGSVCVAYPPERPVPGAVKTQIEKALARVQGLFAGRPPEQVTVTSHEAGLGRDIVGLDFVTDKTCRHIRIIFYKRGYNLGSDAGDRHIRLATDLVELYRHFSLHSFANEFRAVGIEIQTVIDLIGAAFRKSLAREVFRERPAGADTNHIYQNESQTLIVKDLKPPPKQPLRLPGVTVDAMSSYQRAHAYHGHLAIRYLPFCSLSIRVKDADGGMAERTVGRAIVQKFVSVLLEESLWDMELHGRRCRGILAEAIEDGDLERAKLLIECWLLSVRAKILRGLINFDIKPENYGYDPSVGRVGALDLGQVFAWDDFMPEQADLFIRELQNVRERICGWAAICPRAGVKWAQRLRHYLEEAVRYIFRIRDDFCFDIRKDVRELRAETDYEELEEDFRDLSGRHMTGLEVCFAGTEHVRAEAARIIASHLRDSGVSLREAELVFARIGFKGVRQEYQLLRRFRQPLVSDGVSYVEFSDGDYVGLKGRLIHAGPVVQTVLETRRYLGRALSDADLSLLRTEVAQCLIRYYTPGQDVYRTIARRFGLNDKLYVSYRLPMERELSRIPFGSLSEEDLRFLSELLDTEVRPLSLIQCSIAFDHLFERRLYPRLVTLMDFQVKENARNFQKIEIVSFGGLIQKVRESDVILAVNERLGVRLEEIFAAVENYLGIRGATLFLEAAYHQTRTSHPDIAVALETRLDLLFKEHYACGLYPHVPGVSPGPETPTRKGRNSAVR